jgi:hypothetical protein
MRNFLGLPVVMVAFAVGATAAHGTTLDGTTLPYVAPSGGTDAAIALNQWYTFTWGGTGSSFANVDSGELGINPASIGAPDPAWTFTLPTGGTLTIVDGFASGDQFNVTDSGVSLGDTSVPIAGGACANNITACLANADMSKGVFALGAGSHSIDGTAIASPFGGGAGFFEVTSTGATPLPGALPLFATGLGALGLLGWFGMRKARVGL